MDRRIYLRTPAHMLRGRKVKTLHGMTSGLFSIPAGTIATITGKQGGLSIEGPKCDHCGVAVRINKVPCSDVELL